MFPSNRWQPGRPEIQEHAHRIDALLADLSRKEKQDFSVARALLHLANDGRGEGGIEAEVSAEICKRLGVTTAGMFIPTRLNAAGLDTKTGAAGGYTTATEVRDIIELLRNKTRVIQMGATVLSGLQGNVQFPTQTSAASGAWVAQNPGSDVSASDAAFGVKTLSPKTYQATTSFSRQMLAQSSADVENFVRNDLAIAHALAIDLAAINGSGTANQPKGILQTAGIGSVALGTDGAVPTAASIVDLETAIAAANADESGMKFLTTPGMRGKLRKIGRMDSVYASIPLWDSPSGATPGIGNLNGYDALVSNQVPSTLVKGASGAVCHAIIFGYWPSLLIAEWGVLELVVDPYALKRQAMIECTSFQLVDVGIRQVAQFAAIADAKLS